MIGKLILLNVATLGAIFVHAPESAYAQVPAIEIDNGFGYRLHIWIWPRQQSASRKGWVKPVPYLVRSGSVRLRLATPGDYFLVARDTARNDDPLGWVDMHEVVRRAPQAHFRVEGKYVTRTETREYTVTKYKQEQRMRTVRVWRNGQWVEETRSYTVRVPVTETRQREVQVRRPDVELKVSYRGQLLTLEEFFRMTDNRP